ncbi:MAG: hypothetical protein WCF10_15210 [Polyangiales bacterium]
MAYRWLGVVLLSTAFVFGCVDAGTGEPRGEGGSGGTAGSSGNGGNGGTAGVGGSQVSCVTSLICQSCPAEGFCGSDVDCSAGSICVESGCDRDGIPIKQCLFAGGGACDGSTMCPEGRACTNVPGEGMRCVRIAPGCDTSFDCPLGFACENTSCVDRRIPCDLDEQCPKNHLCGGSQNSRFCRRIHIDCLEDFDCDGLAQTCADIDGDGKKECAGVFNPNAPSLATCVNADCSDPSAPVCEAAGYGSTSECGQYGLCRNDSDCAVGFSCIGLWQDLRKECVPGGGSCSSFAQCPVRQVCASPRAGGAPSCQAGYQP